MNFKYPMSVCKGIAEEIKKISKIIDFEIDDENANTIADNIERFLLDILEESAEISRNDKRKIVTVEDIKKAVNIRKIEILDPLFE